MRTTKMSVLVSGRQSAIMCMMLVGLASAATAQVRNTENTLKLDESGERQVATIDRVAWMAGSWEGEAFGGTFEEVWSAPSAGTMVGTFKLMHDGKLSMVEIIMIVEVEGSLEVRLKHFNADFSVWEKKDEYVSFPLVRLKDDAAYFEGLTYIRKGDEQLQVYLATRREGGLHEEELVFNRAK